VTAHRPGYGLPSDSEVRQHILNQFFLRLTKAPFDITDATLHPAHATRPDDPTLICANCPRRTGANPDLFGDVPNADLCTDPSCFAAKRAAHVERAIAAELARATEAGETVLRLSDDYARADGGGAVKGDGVTAPLPRSAFVQLYTDRRCDNATRGVFVDGPTAGTVVDVCVSASCPVHRASGVGGDWREKEQERRQKARRETHLRSEVLDRAVAQVKLGAGGMLPRAVFQLTLDRLLPRLALSSDCVAQLAKSLGLKPPPKASGKRDPYGAIARQIAQLSGPDLSRLLIRFAFVSEVVVHPYDSTKPEHLIRLARLTGVDLKAARRDAMERVKGSEKKKRTPRVVKDTDSGGRQAAEHPAAHEEADDETAHLDADDSTSPTQESEPAVPLAD